MSVKAMTWVFDHSPFLLGARLIHLAIADVVNDDYDNRVFIGDDRIAEKASVSRSTVTRTKAKMIAEGYLEVISDRVGPGKFAEYRFLMPLDNVRHIDAGSQSTCVILHDNVRHPAAERASSENSDYLSTQIVTQENFAPVAQKPRSKPTDDPLTKAAHQLTVLAMEQPVKPVLREGGKGAFPAVMAIIERLLKSGKSRQEVERAIRYGVEVWTVAGFQTTIAQTNPRAKPSSNPNSFVKGKVKEKYEHL